MYRIGSFNMNLYTFVMSTSCKTQVHFLISQGEYYTQNTMVTLVIITQLGQTKDYKIDISFCCFSNKHAPLRVGDWLARTCLPADCCLRGYHTLQGDNSLKSVERFDHMMFVCRFQASR
jgi:hypothetical protein